MINTFESKIVENLDDKTEYRPYPAYSQSQIRTFALGPTDVHYYKNYVFEDRPMTSPTTAMMLGSIYHKRMEFRVKSEFEQKFKKLNKNCRRGTKAYEEAELSAKANGKEIVPCAIWDQTEAMADATLKNPLLEKLIEEGTPEESFFSSHKGIPVKGRTDLRIPERGIILDWKTCEDSNPHSSSFKSPRKTITDSLLDWQAALYTNELEKITGQKYDFVFCFIEKKYPYATSLITLTPQDLREAKVEVYAALERLHECMETDKWGDGYGNQIHEISLDKRWRNVG